MAPEFVDRQIRLWSAMGGPQARFSVSAKWGAFSAYRGTDESAQTLDGLKFAAIMGDLEDGPPHPETMAALAVMAQLGKSVPQVVVLERAERAMEFCREGLKRIPQKHTGGLSDRRYAKRKWRRFVRRWVRVDPENAPTKLRSKGWE